MPHKIKHRQAKHGFFLSICGCYFILSINYSNERHKLSDAHLSQLQFSISIYSNKSFIMIMYETNKT